MRPRAPALLTALMIVVAAGSHAYWLTRLGYRLLAPRPSASA